jgi:hypothetical protein
MIKATLRYTDCLQDGRKLYEVLTNNKVVIASTKRSWSMYPRVVILVKDYDYLSCLLHELNAKCTYEVRLLKYHVVKDRK